MKSILPNTQARGALCLLVLFLFLSPSAAPAQEAGDLEEAGLWEALRSGEAVAMMRHAIAPGTGDPTSFTLSDCATQRNLSEEGRRQARAIGERFRQQGISKADVFTSQWCRCRDTAAELTLGEARDLPPLNSFFADRERQEPQMAALRDWLSQHEARQPLVLVTHQVNITALTGVYPRSGEIVVFAWEEGEAKVLGRL
ncbi:histidine phosphatase family protein [Limibacillus halophilus]